MTDFRQRRPRVEDPKYLERIRLLPCCVCGASGPSDAAHIRMSDAEWGGHWNKRSTGMGEKPSDRWALPLCRQSYRPDPVARILTPAVPVSLVNIGCHGRQHGHDKDFLKDVDKPPPEQAQRDYIEVQFWKRVGKNPFVIADTLYKKFGTDQAARAPRLKKIKPRKPREERAKVPAGRKMQSKPFPKKKRTMHDAR